MSNTRQNREEEIMIVGVGAADGGIEAMRAFFRETKPHDNICYVVILHLSPEQESVLMEVLQASTELPVIKVSERIKVSANHIYVLPSDQHLAMQEEYLLVTKKVEVQDKRAPIDIFFRTLADAHGPLAAAVVLSGSGANGSMGLKRVKEMGGTVFVQNPMEAEYSEMLRNAIATELVDEILPAGQIPEKIRAFKNHVGSVVIPVEADKRAEDVQLALRTIFTQLRLQTGHDFANYKRPTLLRRIERRINVRQQADLPSYAAYIQQNPEEVVALLKDLLISVTNFFRDKKAFEFIETEVLPVILSRKNTHEQLRIWVAGCATGEEAYSLAMLLAEKTSGLIDAPKIQIFATDIDETAISIAREALYTINDAADVSPERLRQFFNKEGSEYRVRREIRELVLFANHNFLKDPPFSQLDMISCRNVLIYLNQVAQERVMESFHFALQPGGMLFLGSAESADSASDLYTVYNREFHVFQSRQVKLRTYPVPESVPSLGYIQPLHIAELPGADLRNRDRITFGDLHQRMLEAYAPPSIVINEEFDIVHLSERAGKYLEVAGGEPTQNLLKLIKPELRLDVRAALCQALQQQSHVEVRNLVVDVGKQQESLNIQVQPVLQDGNVAKGFILVLFERISDVPENSARVMAPDEPVSRQLEEELIRVKIQLRTAVEQHEFQAEELKASNEELQAMNEELRSSAEELETSKEELQSINEELRTVNLELKIKVEETTTASNNLQNLINSTDIGAIFLDRSLRVALFTPAARELFNVIENDIGRPLTDITNRLVDDIIIGDAERVIQKLKTIEREISSKDGRFFMMRILPYRTAEDQINGVVLTFIDITARKFSDQAMVESESRFRNFVTASSDAMFVMSADWKQMQSLHSSRFLVETTSINNNWLRQYIPEDEQAKFVHAISDAINLGQLFELEHKIIRKDGSIGWALTRAINRLNNAGQVIEWFGAATDITDRKRRDAEAELFAQIQYGLTQATAPAEIMRTVGRRLGKFLNVSLCYLIELDQEKRPIALHELWTAKVNVTGATAFRQLWINTQRGLPSPDVTTVVNDTEYDRNSFDRVYIEQNVRAFVCVPFDRHGHKKFLFFMGNDEPRVWSPEEITLLHELAARIVPRFEHSLAEDALRRSEARQHFLVLLGDGIRALTQPGDILATTCGMLSGFLKVEGLFFHIPKREREHRYNITGHFIGTLPEIPFESSLDDFFENRNELLEGGPTLIEDTGNMKNTSGLKRPAYLAKTMRAIASVPIIKNGELIWIINAVHDRPRHWSSEEVSLMREVAERTWDAVERARAVEELRVSEERYRAALQSAAMAAWDWDIQQDSVVWNDQHYFLLGLEPDGLPKNAAFFSSFVHSEDLEMVTEQLQIAITDSGIFRAQFRGIRRDNNKVCWFSGYGRVVEKSNVKATRMVGVMHDITESKLLEQQKDEFIGIASHELKTPVTSIKIYGEILQERFEEADDVANAQMMKAMNAQVDRLIELIANLFDTTRIAEGKLLLLYEELDLNQLVSERAEEVQRISPKHNITLNLGEVPLVSADRERISQVLTNLLSNAVNYSPSGGDVVVTSKKTGNALMVSVKDSGIGIAKESQSKIFERFFRVDVPSLQTYPGMGMGLYISSGIISRHGGAITVTSEEGKGSIFTFTLPVPE